MVEEDMVTVFGSVRKSVSCIANCCRSIQSLTDPENPEEFQINERWLADNLAATVVRAVNHLAPLARWAGAEPFINATDYSHAPIWSDRLEACITELSALDSRVAVIGRRFYGTCFHSASLNFVLHFVEAFFRMVDLESSRLFLLLIQIDEEDFQQVLNSTWHPLGYRFFDAMNEIGESFEDCMYHQKTSLLLREDQFDRITAWLTKERRIYQKISGNFALGKADQVQSPQAMLGRTEMAELPTWDSEVLVLKFRGKEYGRDRRLFTEQSKNLLTLLNAFQEDGWKARIDNPFVEDKHRAAVHELNKKLRAVHCPIEFLSGGDGQSLKWRIANDYEGPGIV